MMMSRRHLLLGTMPVCLSRGAPARAAETAPLVAVAASLQGLIEAYAATFERETGKPLRLVFGATANFVRQIEQGAPFELFLAADDESVQRLARNGLTAAPPAVFARGELRLATRQASALPVDQGLAGIRSALQSGALRRIAMANPELAPYGRAAQQALQAAGLWELMQPRLMLGENVSLTTSLVATGGAEAGLVAGSTLKLPAFARVLRSGPVAADQYAPIRHGAALLKGAGPAAAAAFERIIAADFRILLAAHGFSAP
jgi:molybdate transport system substrate-binding protein